MTDPDDQDDIDAADDVEVSRDDSSHQSPTNAYVDVAGERPPPPPGRPGSRLIGDINVYRHRTDDERPYTPVKAGTSTDLRYASHEDWELDHTETRTPEDYQ